MNAVFKSFIGTMGRRTMMLALSLALVAAVLVAIPTNKVLAAAITGIAYTPSGATVGTFVAASSTVATFTPTTAITAGSTITLTFPAGTTLANIVASDFTIQQAANGGVAGTATAPSVIAFDNTAKTITFTVAAGSLSTGTGAGTGVVTIATFSSAGGNEIQHPTTATTTGSFTVATSVGDTGTITNVTFVAGAATAVTVETAANGSGSVYGPASVTAGTTATVYSITRDTYGNFVANVAATAWSLTGKTAGVVDGDLVAAGDSKSAVFTGHLVGTAVIHVTSGVLTAGNSGTVTVTVGAAAAVFVETAANGSGTVYGPAAVYVNATATVYSITRDAQGNFVANVAATAWSLTSKTGGVVDGDLVAAGDVKSAVFSGHLLGTAIIHVTSGALTAGNSGMVSVVRSSGGGGGHSDTPVVTPASVDLTLPNGGNTLTGGSVIGISWTSSNGAFVSYRVSYSADNGNNWTVLATVPGTSYSWTVPTTSTNQGLIKVEGLDSAGTILASDTSSTTFVVKGTTTAPPSVEPPTSTTPPATDDTVEGTYDVEHAKSNNPDFNTDMNLPAAPPFTAWCVSGSLIKSASLPAVYYCGADGKRYVFVNDKAFFSWYENFSTVQTINDETMSKITIGGNITYRPGTRMIKVQSDPKVYVVARGGILRWVATENAAKRLFGDNWNTMIDDVSDSFFVNYKIGTPISQ